MTLNFSALAIALAATALAGAVHAQRVEIPESGYVRISATGYPRAVGNVVRLTDDTVTLRRRDSLVVIPRGQVTRVEVPDGRRRYVGPGLLVGLGIGAGLGAAGGALCSEDCPEGTVMTTTFIGAAGGMILGAGIGALITGDRWRNVSVPREGAAIMIAPERRGMRIAMRLTTR